MTRFLILTLFTILAVVFFGDASLADSKIKIPPTFKDSGSGQADINSFADGIATILYIFAGVFAFFGVLTGAMMIMDDDGDGGWRRIRNVAKGGGVIMAIGLIAQAFA